ncbi:MAG: 16S rRNA (guanine(527)-N(7))-methyltransferase RsmG [Nitrospirae bacterium YQR-1]
MKKENKPNPEEILAGGLAALSIEPSDRIINSFLTYLHELKKWSGIHNLTAVKDDAGIVTTHFLDSLLYLRGVPAGAKTILDVGSGAGFPGIPIKIVHPGLTATLLEPRKKRAVFLRHMIHLLRLSGTDVIESRLQDVKLPPQDCITVRALFSFSDFIKLALPLLNTDGTLVIGKAAGYESEIPQNTDDYKIDIVQCKIPHTDIERFIITVKGQHQSTKLHSFVIPSI